MGIIIFSWMIDFNKQIVRNAWYNKIEGKNIKSAKAALASNSYKNPRLSLNQNV